MTDKSGPARVRGGKSVPMEPKDGKTSTAPALVVGVGASEGSRDPIHTLLAQLEPGCGLAIVLVQPRSPVGNPPPDLNLQKIRIKVKEAADGLPLEPDHVYVMPARGLPSVINGKFSIQDLTQCQGLRMPVDHLLCTLAADQGRRCVGIILSGAGTDGAGGLAEIRVAGGMTIAQDPETAEFPDMPANAIAAGHADDVLTPDKMAARLTDRLNEIVRLTDLQEEGANLDAVILAVRNATGHDFHFYKRATLARRAQRRMALQNLAGYNDYARMLRTDREEATALRKDLLIGVTDFFRQPEAWRVLEEKVVSELIRKAAPESTLRVWVPACSIGKEAYCIAMLMVEGIERSGKKLSLQIFATDADESAVEVARAGLYPEADIKGVSAARLERFCARKQGKYEFIKELRSVIVFAPQDLIADPPFSKVDLITCRNLLIYLDQALQRKIIQLLHFALREGGHLFLGSAETICGRDDLFEPIEQKWRIYRKLGVSTPAHLDLPLRPQARPAGVFPAATPQPRLTLPSITQQALAERFAPAAALVDRKGALMYLHGNVEDFLQLTAGEHTGLLVDAAREGLRNRLTSAVLQAVTQGKRIVAQARVRKDKKSVPVKVTVSPLRHPREAEGLLLVTFEAQKLRQAVPSAAEGGLAHVDMLGLEDELKFTRNELSSTIEQLEHSNEHLKASNEEVTSANEELQSTNEELETSKEELQSLNEELNAVNQRLQEKVAELEQAGNDMTNLLNSGDIATIFLDRELRVRRFTSAVSRLFNLIDSDLNRPLTDITRKFQDDALLDDARRVLLNLTPATADVRAEDGAWYSRRILPYRTMDDRIEGVVITFNDVSEERRLVDVVRASEERFRLLVEGVRDHSIYMLDPKGLVVSWNDGAQRIKGWAAEEVIGQSFLRFYAPEAIAAGHPQAQLDRAMAEGSCTAEGWQIRKDGSRFWAGITITALRDQTGDLRGFTKITRDITERKRAEEALCEARDREAWLARFPQDNPNPVLRVSAEGIMLYCNPAAGALPGWTCRSGEQISGPLARLVEEALAQGRQVQMEALFGDRTYLTWAVPILKDGYVNVYARDISERKQAEEALRRSEARYHSLFDNMAEAFALHEIITDEQGTPCDYRFLEVNESFERMTGLKRSDIVHRNVRDVLPAIEPFWIETYGQVALTGEPVNFEKYYPTPLDRWYQVFAYRSAPCQFAAIFLDISRRKQAEEALRQSEERMRLATQAAKIGAFEWDVQTGVNVWTPELEALYGLARGEFGKTQPAWEQLIHPEDRLTAVGLVNHAFETGEPVEGEWRVVWGDGSVHWIAGRFQASKDSDGKPQRLSGVNLDITGRKQAEQKLHQSYLDLDRAQAVGQIGSWRLDVGRNVLQWSDENYRIFGVPRGTPLDYGTFLGRVHPEDRQYVDACWQAGLAGEPYDIEHRIVAGNQEKWVREKAYLEFDDAGRLIGGFGITQDITERKRSEESLLRAKAELEQRVHERTAQIRSLAPELTQAEQRERKRLAEILHDHLQQLLVGAKFGLGVARKRAIGEDIRQSLDEVSALLDESIGASKSLTVELSPPILHEAGLAAALNWLSRWMKEKHGLTVEVESDTEIEPDAEGVCMLLFQCARELLLNVVKHSGARSARITIGRMDDHLEIIVADQGVGFDPTRSQAPNSAAGFGLLSIRERLRMVGGRMEVDSAPSLGTRVSLIAPFPEPKSPKVEEPMPPAGVAPLDRTEAGEESLRSGRIRVLVADDHKIMRQGLIQLLRLEPDLEVVGEAQDGEVAVEMATRLLPDIVIMDMSMPKLGGIEATRRISAEAPGVRVIGLSMFEEADRARSMLEAGAVAYIHKAGPSQDLIAAIRAHYPRHRSL